MKRILACVMLAGFLILPLSIYRDYPAYDGTVKSVFTRPPIFSIF